MTKFQVAACAIEFCGSFILFVFSGFIRMGRKGLPENSKYMVYMNLVAALMLVSDGFAYIFRGNPSAVGYYAVRITNFLAFFCNYMIIPIFMLYLSSATNGANRKINLVFEYIELSLVGICVVFLIASQFNGMYYYFDESNTYIRGPLFTFISCIGVVDAVLFLVMIVVNFRALSKFDKAASLIYVLLPSISFIISIYFYGYSLYNIFLFVTMVYVYTLIQHKWYDYVVDAERQLNKKKNNIMYALMQPHFMFNTLGSIEALIGKDNEKAKEVLYNISSYIRGNLDAAQGPELISFDEELKHLGYYVALEEVRFGDRINIDYDIEVRNFLLPYESVETLVENSVRRGISKKPNGGTCLISTKELDNGHIQIVVEDDGLGIDCNLNHGVDEHALFEDIKDRIKRLCNGKVTCECEEGIGTKIVIEMEMKR